MKIVSLVERDGEKRSTVVEVVTGESLRKVLTKHVCKSAHLMTDDHSGYTKAGREYASHGAIRHSAGSTPVATCTQIQLSLASAC